jgi:hypothetical protein
MAARGFNKLSKDKAWNKPMDNDNDLLPDPDGSQISKSGYKAFVKQADKLKVGHMPMFRVVVECCNALG